VAVHETAHLIDRTPSAVVLRGVQRKETWWSVEGYAVLVQYLWSLGPDAERPSAAFTGNRAAPAVRTILGTGQGGFCERPERARWAQWFTPGGDAYPLACQATRYALERLALHDPSLSTRDLLTRWSTIRDRRTVAGAITALLGTDRPARAVTGEWLLSWVADDWVAGTAPALQDQAVDLRALYGAWFPGGYPVPDATLTLGEAVADTLGEPDVRFVEATLPADGWLAVTGPGGAGLPADRADMMLLRVR
jgi:hypothetical protein